MNKAEKLERLIESTEAVAHSHLSLAMTMRAQVELLSHSLKAKAYFEKVIKDEKRLCDEYSNRTQLLRAALELIPELPSEGE